MIDSGVTIPDDMVVGEDPELDASASGALSRASRSSRSPCSTSSANDDAGRSAIAPELRRRQRRRECDWGHGPFVPPRDNSGEGVVRSARLGAATIAVAAAMSGSRPSPFTRTSAVVFQS